MIDSRAEAVSLFRALCAKYAKFEVISVVIAVTGLAPMDFVKWLEGKRSLSPGLVRRVVACLRESSHFSNSCREIEQKVPVPVGAPRPKKGTQRFRQRQVQRKPSPIARQPSSDDFEILESKLVADGSLLPSKSTKAG